MDREVNAEGVVDCQALQGELPGYHFGVVEASMRAALEQHLLGCRRCLVAFLSLKRALETAAADRRPSDAARARLRRAAGEALDRLATERRWWRTTRARIALAAVGAAALALLALRALEPAPGAEGPLHDSARPVVAAETVL